MKKKQIYLSIKHNQKFKYQPQNDLLECVRQNNHHQRLILIRNVNKKDPVKRKRRRERKKQKSKIDTQLKRANVNNNNNNNDKEDLHDNDNVDDRNKKIKFAN